MINKLIEKLRRDSTWPTNDYGMVLYALVRATRPKIVFEIGTYKGFSTLCIVKGLMENGNGLVYSIEKHHFFEFEKLPKKIQSYIRYSVMRSDSIEFEKLLDQIREIDLAFIDGDHSYNACKQDFEKIFIKIKDGGLIVFHDADQVKIRKVLNEIDLPIIYLPTFGGLAIVQKTGYNPEENLRYWSILN